MARKEYPIPAEFAWLSGRVHFLHRSTATELASDCPYCGGNLHKNGDWPDRLRWFVFDGRPRLWCRKCGVVIFPDSEDHSFKPDYEQMRQWNADREAFYRKQKYQAEHALQLLEKEREWLKWHEQMSAAHKQWWLSRGVPEDWQAFWKLGYLDQRTFANADEFFTRPAATIPKFDFGWQVRNIDFRIQDPPKNVGKYRPLANLPAAYYVTTPQEEGLRDEVFAVEGSIKAMIVSMRTGQEQRQVIGLPSCNSWAGAEQALKDCGRVWILFDPDATCWAYKFAKEVGSNARIVELGGKPDDAILRYGMTPANFEFQLRQAVKL